MAMMRLKGDFQYFKYFLCHHPIILGVSLNAFNLSYSFISRVNLFAYLYVSVKMR